MSAAEHFRTVAAGMTARVDQVPANGWEQPSPCEGWVARDVIRHLAEWLPWFLRDGAGIELDPLPSPDDDPSATWASIRDQLQAILERADVGETTFESEMFGSDLTLDVAIQRFVTGDVLIHTWDLARACGLDESLDADAVHHMYEGMKPMAPMLAASGHFAPVVEVPDDADEQTKLLGLTGRRA
jgi:uncharacterized protein (TIGR03086 family)